MWSDPLCRAQTLLPHFYSLYFWRSLYPFTTILQTGKPTSCWWAEIMGWSQGVTVGRKMERSYLILTGSFWDAPVHIVLPFVFLSIWAKTEMVLCALRLTCLRLKVRQDSESACPLWRLWGREGLWLQVKEMHKLHALMLVIVCHSQTRLAAGPLLQLCCNFFLPIRAGTTGKCVTCIGRESKSWIKRNRSDRLVFTKFEAGLA